MTFLEVLSRNRISYINNVHSALFVLLMLGKDMADAIVDGFMYL